MWSKVSCLRKQLDGRDWASNHRPQRNNPYITAPSQSLHVRAMKSFSLPTHVVDP